MVNSVFHAHVGALPVFLHRILHTGVITQRTEKEPEIPTWPGSHKFQSPRLYLQKPQVILTLTFEFEFSEMKHSFPF